MHFEVASVWLAWPSRRGAFVIAWSRVCGCLRGAVARAKGLCSLRPAENIDIGLWAHRLPHAGRDWSAQLAAARKQAAWREILLWMTPSEAPKALQASECSELLDPMRASCWISAQH